MMRAGDGRTAVNVGPKKTCFARQGVAQRVQLRDRASAATRAATLRATRDRERFSPSSDLNSPASVQATAAGSPLVRPPDVAAAEVARLVQTAVGAESVQTAMGHLTEAHAELLGGVGEGFAAASGHMLATNATFVQQLHLIATSDVDESLSQASQADRQRHVTLAIEMLLHVTVSCPPQDRCTGAAAALVDAVITFLERQEGTAQALAATEQFVSAIAECAPRQLLEHPRRGVVFAAANAAAETSAEASVHVFALLANPSYGHLAVGPVAVLFRALVAAADAYRRGLSERQSSDAALDNSATLDSIRAWANVCCRIDSAPSWIALVLHVLVQFADDREGRIAMESWLGCTANGPRTSEASSADPLNIVGDDEDDDNSRVAASSLPARGASSLDASVAGDGAVAAPLPIDDVVDAAWTLIGSDDETVCCGALSLFSRLDHVTATVADRYPLLELCCALVARRSCAREPALDVLRCIPCLVGARTALDGPLFASYRDLLISGDRHLRISALALLVEMLAAGFAQKVQAIVESVNDALIVLTDDTPSAQRALNHGVQATASGGEGDWELPASLDLGREELALIEQLLQVVDVDPFML